MRVEEDAWFQAEVRRQLPEILPDMAAHYLRGNMNQLRMWSRIVALGDIVREQEAESGQRFDHVILLRSDLIIHGGSLAMLVEEAKSFETSVISDFDPHAEYIEGIGDRYFVGSRDAIDPLFGCFDWLLEKVRTNSPSLIRLNPHEGASSVLFATGRNARPKTSIFYEIHRGRFPLASMMDAVAADARFMGERGIDNRLQRLFPAFS